MRRPRSEHAIRRQRVGTPHGTGRSWPHVRRRCGPPAASGLRTQGESSLSHQPKLASWSRRQCTLSEDAARDPNLSIVSSCMDRKEVACCMVIEHSNAYDVMARGHACRYGHGDTEGLNERAAKEGMDTTSECLPLN